MKTPKIVVRKLGRHKAAGLAHNLKKDGKKFGTIELDPRLEMHGGNKGYFDTAVHEAIHMVDPLLHEDDVAEMATKITNILWAHGYRKVNL